MKLCSFTAALLPGYVSTSSVASGYNVRKAHNFIRNIIVSVLPLKSSHKPGRFVQLTGLHISAALGQPLALYKLITMQANDVNLVDVWGLTPLDHAVRNSKWACAVLLVSSGGVLLVLHLPSAVTAIFCCRTGACSRQALKRHLVSSRPAMEVHA